jgi:CheY-like chemotaxis protein
VLLVDDEALLRKALAKPLARAGYAVTCAASLAEAVRRLDGEERFDHAIVDLELPDGDGGDIVSLCEMMWWSPDVIATTERLTAARCVEFRDRCPVLPKPVGIDVLLELLGLAEDDVVSAFAREHSLSARETEVLAMLIEGDLAAGGTTPERASVRAIERRIARKLGLSEDGDIFQPLVRWVLDPSTRGFKLAQIALERRRRSSWRQPWATRPVRFEA